MPPKDMKGLSTEKNHLIRQVCGEPILKKKPEYEKGQENISFREIDWIIVPSIGICGHGIEFHYQTNGESILIGFIDGFGWMHNTDNKVRVYLLSSNSKEWNKLLAKAEHILKDLKDSVLEILQNNNLHSGVRNNIVTWLNG